MAAHELFPSSSTLHWGYFDAALKPALTIAPGDTVTIHSVSGAPADLPPPGSGMTVASELADIHANARQILGPHMMTGPVAVQGAEPGDALRVEILDIRLRDDWGYNFVKPLIGALPYDIAEFRRIHLAIDKDRRIVITPWGFDIPAAPFFGVMGSAPPRAWGQQTSIIPRAFGGNMDNKMLTAGTTVYFPVFEPGGLFSAGDGHAAQGDGEVCVTAVETGLTGMFHIGLIKKANLALPRAETATHYITMGFSEDLDDAAETALREMIGWIVSAGKHSFEDAYRMCSLVADLHVTQLVNVHKGAHMILPKWTGVVGAA
jgi:acetamidase/formamidase